MGSAGLTFTYSLTPFVPRPKKRKGLWLHVKVSTCCNPTPWVPASLEGGGQDPLLISRADTNGSELAN